MDRKPTQEQVKEFWEWCGLHYNKPSGGYFWDEEDNVVIDMHKGETGIDLNNLFKYTPLWCKEDLSINFYEVHQLDGKIITDCILEKDAVVVGRGCVEGKLKDVANYALFWALWKIWIYFPGILQGFKEQ